MPAFSPRIRGHIDEALTFLKWVLYACNIGLIVGAVAVAFHYGIDWAAQFRRTSPGSFFSFPWEAWSSSCSTAGAGWSGTGAPIWC